MKVERHSKIVELIGKYDIETQEELAEKLNESGFNVTQATVSRDIKELKLIKKINKNGIYRYAAPSENFFKQNLFKDTVTDIDFAVNTVVVKCHTGMAQAACAALDSMDYNGIVGTIAGDDTIFILMRSEADARKLVKTFKELVWGA